jgi:hypothetical protein
VAREQRKLAAIVAADVVGYSRLMGRDESSVIAQPLRPLLFQPLDTRRYVGSDPDPVRCVDASQDPHRFVRLGLFGVSLSTHRSLARVTL